MNDSQFAYWHGEGKIKFPLEYTGFERCDDRSSAEKIKINEINEMK